MRRIGSLLLIGAVTALVAGCASLPPLEGRTATTAVASVDTAGTRLGRAIAARVDANPGKTGVHAVPDPRDAFAARVAIASAAEKTIDAQYYIWHDDQVGNLLFEALWQAAERGVRVRLLLDDLNTKGLDATIAALDAHPNVDVRLYNPLVQRDVRVANFVTDFSRVNRRMHNKSFIVDNQVAIVGGRNIGNEYFAAGSGVAFADLDVIAIGAVVAEVSKEFDLYWNSPSAYPAASFVGAANREALVSKFSATHADAEAMAYTEAVRSSPLLRELLERALAFEWTTARVVNDDPAKTLDASARTDVLLFPELMRTMGRPEKSLDMISPYFVPGDGGTEALVAASKRGVRVRILTNSLSSSDVSAVHAGYAKRRLALLRAGVRLYELKATRPRESREETSGAGSSGTAALHAKTFAVDGARIFVGSFNLDPRSARINTEMGVVIDSSALAQRLANAFDTAVPGTAYEVRLRDDGSNLEWIERTASGEIRYDTEPATSWWLRSKVEMLSILPIEPLL
jgi:putative cardiolipin synthase